MITSAQDQRGEASYATLARVLTALFDGRPPVARQNVRSWHLRGTVNKDGKKFPAPVREAGNPRHGQARYLFSTAEVIKWAAPGVPERGSNQKQAAWRE